MLRHGLQVVSVSLVLTVMCDGQYGQASVFSGYSDIQMAMCMFFVVDMLIKSFRLLQNYKGR